MPSPFPGMNPYFESPTLWEDFHQSLAAEIRDQLVPKLRPKYYLRIDYTQPPPKPDFSDEDGQWIRDMVAIVT